MRIKTLTRTRWQQGKRPRGVRLPEQGLGQLWCPILQKRNDDNDNTTVIVLLGNRGCHEHLSFINSLFTPHKEHDELV